MKVAIIQIHGCGILGFFKKIIISGHIIFCDLPPAPPNILPIVQLALVIITICNTHRAFCTRQALRKALSVGYLV